MPIWAQDPAFPVVIRRLQPASLPLDDASFQRKIQADLAALRNSAQDPASSTNPAPDADIPDDFNPAEDIPLSPTAQAAVHVSEKWLTTTVTPAPGADGRVVYTYGAGLATVVCAPLRVCTIELQAGERLTDEPHIGDSVRWHLTPAVYGPDRSSTTVVVLKPLEAGLDTTLLIPTDRRVYYLRLLSKPFDYTARVAFAYPEDEDADRQWRDHLERQRAYERDASRIESLAPTALESMNFNYEIKGDTAIRPLMVFDDGTKTFVRMGPDIRNRELPILAVVGTDGKAELLNYRVVNGLYIADRLFDRAQLLLGVGKKALKVEIRRGK